MAGGGVGEAMLIGAAVGAGTGGIMSAVQDKDPLEGALLGAAMGAAGGGLGSGIGGALSGATTGAEAGAATGALSGEAGAAGVSAAEGSQIGALTAQNTGLGMTGAEQTANLLGTANAAPGSQAAILAEQNAGMGLTQAQSNANIMSSVTPGTTSAPATTGGVSDLSQWGQAGKGSGFAPGLTNAQAYGAGAGGGIMGLVGNSQNQGEQWAPEQEPYSGSLSYFKYNPQTFRPSVAPGYADGGVASLQPTAMYPQSQLDTTQFAVPSQRPASREVVNADYDARINPYTGDMMMASGGISSLGSYSDGGRMLKGPGDGMSDDIPGVIAGKQPARLADGEFVVPADVVSHLGNGSTDAGAKKLYSMMDNVRKARTGSKRQGKQIKADKYVPGMASGGIAYYDEGGDTSSEQVATKADVEAAINAARGTPAGMSTEFQASGYEPSAAQYSQYTMANRPSSSAPQYYQDIYVPSYPDYSTPGYTLSGNLGQWSNVMGEQQRAAQPASMAQQVTQSYLHNLGRAPETEGFNAWMNSGLTAPQIQREIAFSPESVQRDPTNSANVAAFINKQYQSSLGRDVEASALPEYLNRFASGNTNPYEFSQQVQASPESQIRQAYQTYLGRTPEQAGMANWMTGVNSGMTIDQMRAAIQGSDEGKQYAARQAEQRKAAQKKRSGGIAALRRA